MNMKFTLIEFVKSERDEELPSALDYFAPWCLWGFTQTAFHTIAQIRIPRSITPEEETLLAEAEQDPEIKSLQYSINTYEADSGDESEQS